MIIHSSDIFDPILLNKQFSCRKRDSIDFLVKTARGDTNNFPLHAEKDDTIFVDHCLQTDLNRFKICGPAAGQFWESRGSDVVGWVSDDR